MTGKFKDYGNALLNFCCGVLMCFSLYLCAVFCIDSDISMGWVFVVIISAIAVPVSLPYLLGQGSFKACKNKVIFRIGLIKHTYSYSEIESVEVQTGFTYGRYSSSPCIELIINLSNGNTVTFRDGSVPSDVLSTPEKHKEFHDNHQFTKLCNYINERVGR